MNSDFGLDGKSDATGEAEEARARVSEGGVGEDGARVSPMELDSGSEAGGRSEEDRARVSTESEVGNVDKVMESKGSGIQVDRTRVEISFNDDEDDVFDISRVEIDDDSDKFEAHNGEHPSLLSEFDEFVANEKSGMALGTTRALSYGFEVGDMVWGKVKSHPWWPGHIFNEALATSQVRRTRREGYVLVAFFGDNSYGWFDPAELIPFDPHYAEKSRQTSHRGFLKAVEEAVDEANRRCGVGLACKCRNAYNFRSTSVQGYFVVDVPDYEPGAVYSENQIRKARDSFKPIEILSFVKQLALSPLGDDQKSLSFSKSKATAFSFRKAVFEEYDETYAQAFGAHPGRPSRSLAPAPTRAALSGPLVIAEVLGGRKTATKPMKVKDHSKRDKYLFKRRDEPGNSKTHQTSQGQASSSAPSAVLEGSIALADDNYMLQKRVPDVSGKEAVIIDQAPNSSLTTRDVTVDAKPSLAKGRADLQEVKEGDGDVGPTTTGYVDLLGEGTKQRTVDGTSQPLKQEGEGVFEVKYEESEKLSGSFEKLQQPSNSLKKEEGGYERGVGDPLPIEAKSLGGKKAAGGVKKLKVLKRPAEDLDTKDSMMGDKKKKKKKKQLGAEASVRNQQKPLTSGKVLPSGSKEAGNANHVGLAPREDTPVEHKKDVTSSSNLSESVGKLPIHVLENVQLELSQLVSDLKALALDPFHGIETNSPTIVRQFFLHFRSLVYQKSLVLSPPSETESVEGRSSKSSSGVKASDISPTEQVRDLSSSKPAKPMFRSDDPTIAGRKRAPSDRQGDIAAKRNKKITDIRTLAAEKKAIQRPPIDSKRVEAKESATPVMRKSLKPGFAKKADPASKAVEPTMLVLKFPPKISLPSPAELKAKFARFGPMDQSGLRVFWKSSTCRVVFLYKSDAHAAFKFATANSSLFGNFSVRCQIREVGGPEVPEFDKGDNPRDTPRAKDPLVGQSPALASALRQQQRQAQQSAVQLKSILKKSSGEESAGGQVTGGNGNSKGTARVKFMLGREETSRTTTSDQFMMPGNRNNNFNKNNNSASFADVDGAPSSTSSIAMDFNTSRNFQKVNPPPTFSSPLPPLLPNPPGPPPQYANPPPRSNFPQHSEMAPPRNTSHNLNAPPTAFPSTPTSTVDISQQMLSLLISCSDVVANVQGLLGYLPYHPL